VPRVPPPQDRARQPPPGGGGKSRGYQCDTCVVLIQVVWITLLSGPLRGGRLHVQGTLCTTTVTVFNFAKDGVGKDHLKIFAASTYKQA
jgi:hypothetical protein